MSTLKVGQKVKFRPTHQKDIELAGTVAKVNKDGTVDVQSTAGNGSVSRLYPAHLSDIWPDHDPEPEEEGSQDASEKET